MLHPNIIALQQQVAQQAAASNNQAAPTTPTVLSSSAPSVVEALQQQLGLGGGASGGATVAPAVNPFGAALNLMNPAAGGVVPVQVSEGGRDGSFNYLFYGSDKGKIGKIGTISNFWCCRRRQ